MVIQHYTIYLQFSNEKGGTKHETQDDAAAIYRHVFIKVANIGMLVLLNRYIRSAGTFIFHFRIKTFMGQTPELITLKHTTL